MATRTTNTGFFISHDRDFLDPIVNRIVHVENQQLNEYTGNYSSFETQRAQKLILQQAMFQKQQKQMSHMQSYIDRFRYKASKARQAQKSYYSALRKWNKYYPLNLITHSALNLESRTRCLTQS
ncbi:hypothetical protein AB6D62_023305 [Vibrio cyclitrophicus]